MKRMSEEFKKRGLELYLPAEEVKEDDIQAAE